MGFCRAATGCPSAVATGSRRFLRGRAAKHDYLVYVGIGWAMARLPRFRWPKPGPRPDAPLARARRLRVPPGLLPDRAVRRRPVPGPEFPWPGGRTVVREQRHRPGHRPRAVVHRRHRRRAGRRRCSTRSRRRGEPTCSPARASRRPTRAAPTPTSSRSSASVAGVVPRRTSRRVRAFAADARLQAGLVVPHTALATRVFCGMTPEEAARLTHETRPTPRPTASCRPMRSGGSASPTNSFPVGGVNT